MTEETPTKKSKTLTPMYLVYMMLVSYVLTFCIFIAIIPSVSTLVQIVVGVLFLVFLFCFNQLSDGVRKLQLKAFITESDLKYNDAWLNFYKGMCEKLVDELEKNKSETEKTKK